MSDNEVAVKSNGLFRVKEAARLVSWSDRTPGTEPLTRGQLRELVDSGVGQLRWANVPGGKKHLTFRALISLRLIFRVHRAGISRKYLNYDVHRLKEVLKTEWPFASRHLWYPGSRLLIPETDDPSRLKEYCDENFRRSFYWLNATRPHGLEFDADGIACAWRPAADVKIEPGIMSGRPCIAGTRIPTWVVAGMVDGGDGIAEIADWYDLPAERVKNAVAWERQLVAGGV